jgi:hypothetical protein
MCVSQWLEVRWIYMYIYIYICVCVCVCLCVCVWVCGYLYGRSDRVSTQLQLNIYHKGPVLKG